MISDSSMFQDVRELENFARNKKRYNGMKICEKGFQVVKYVGEIMFNKQS